MAKIKEYTLVGDVEYLESSKKTRPGHFRRGNNSKLITQYSDSYIEGIPSKVNAKLIDVNGEEWEIDLRIPILRYYRRQNITRKLVKQFMSDYKSGHIRLQEDNAGRIIIVPALVQMSLF